MTKFAHENITSIHTVFVDDKNMMLSLEFIGGGELFDTVVKWKRDQRERQTFHYFNQLMSGLQYMHNSGYAHRDLKLENLLLSKDGVLKIADFGVTKETQFNPMRTCCGSPDYIAPEIIEDKKGYDGKLADLWSCGVILYAMLCGEFPFENTSHILRGLYKTPRWFPKVAKESLLDKLLVVKPPNRIQSVEQVVKTEWMQSFTALRNAFGMFHEVQDLLCERRTAPGKRPGRGGADGDDDEDVEEKPESKQVLRLRAAMLRVLIMVKVCRALSHASIKGQPRDVRAVTYDRLMFVLHLLNSWVVTKQGKQTVDWAGLRNCSQFCKHLELLAEVQRCDLKVLSKNDRKAVLLNFYHLIVIHGCAAHEKHIGDMKEKDKKSFFANTSLIIGTFTSLSVS
jgi:hypothetical protein